MKFLARKGAKRELCFPRWQVNSNGTLLPELPALFDQMSHQLGIAELLNFPGGDSQMILSVSKASPQIRTQELLQQILKSRTQEARQPVEHKTLVAIS